MARLAVLVVLALAGCSFDGESASIERGKLGKLVLQPADLAREFVRFDEGRQITADSPGGRRSDPARFGRVEGWKARYRRGGTPRTTGPLVVVSRVDVFDSTGGAEDDLAAARADLDDSDLGWNPIDEPGLGDESFAATVVQRGFNAVRHYEVFWRHENATASLSANGFEGRLALSDVLELARKQQRRIADASGG